MKRSRFTEEQIIGILREQDPPQLYIQDRLEQTDEHTSAQKRNDGHGQAGAEVAGQAVLGRQRR